MALSRAYLELLKSDYDDDYDRSAPKRGEEIFEGTDYPRTWDGFVGQEKAKEQLRVAAGSAKARGTRMDHTLIASGIAGVGKTTLATLLAYQAGAGLVRTTGPLDQSDAIDLIEEMEDGDALFVDEIHLMTSTGRNKADWILPFMTEGVMYTARGAVKMPNVTIVGATTDIGRLPLTLISRFMVQPEIVAYSETEGGAIVANLVERMGLDELDTTTCLGVARAADNNPRVMRQILTQVRDLAYAYPDTAPNLDKALEWAGVSPDGLSKISREVLLLLHGSRTGAMSIESLRASLGEPGPIAHHEQSLLRRGLIEITGSGRRLTDAGVIRARQEVRSL